MSKPMAVTLPVVLLILDVYPFRRTGIKDVFMKSWRVVVEKVPFFALSIASLLITIQAQETGSSLIYLKSHLLSDRILLAVRSLMFYIYKILWPADLVPFYPYPAEISIFVTQYIVSFMLVAGITVSCVLTWRRQKLWTAVWAYYVITLVPVLGIIQVGGQAAADRYAYMASIGPFLLIGAGIEHIHRNIKWQKGNMELIKPVKKYFFLSRTKVILMVFSILVLSLLTIRTMRQIGVWENSFVLWNTELKRYPDVSLAYKNLGTSYGETGRYDLALENLKKAIELNPGDPMSFYNRGIVYGTLGMHVKAIEDFKSAIALNPLDAKFYNNLGVAYGILGEYQKAIDNFTAALRFNPMFAKAYFYRGIAYKKLGFNEHALRDIQTAAQLGEINAMKYLMTK
jgi:Tfp pilus assembly protein PilF